MNQPSDPRPSLDDLLHCATGVLAILSEAGIVPVAFSVGYEGSVKVHLSSGPDVRRATEELDLSPNFKVYGDYGDPLVKAQGEVRISTGRPIRVEVFGRAGDLPSDAA